MHTPRFGGFDPAYEITTKISGEVCKDWREEIKRLGDICREHGNLFNEINACAWVFCLAKAIPAFQSVPQDMNPYLHDCSKVLEQRGKKLNEQGVSNSSWAFATLGFYTPALLNTMAGACIRVFRQSDNVKALASSVRALAELRFSDPNFYISAAKIGLKNHKKFEQDNQSLATMAFGLAMGNPDSCKLFMTSFLKNIHLFSFEGIIDVIPIVNAGLVAQVPFSEQFKKIAAKALVELHIGSGKNYQDNLMEEEIGRLLYVAGYKVKRQHWILAYKVDFLLQDKNIIVEFFGRAYHEIRSLENKTEKKLMRGSDYIRHGVLTAQGFKVIYIWDDEWSQLEENKKLDFLEEKIQTVTK